MRNKIYNVVAAYTADCCGTPHVLILRFLCKDADTANKRAHKYCVSHGMEPGSIEAITGAELNKIKVR